MPNHFNYNNDYNWIWINCWRIYTLYLTIAGLTGVSNSEIRALCNSTAVNNPGVNNTIDYTYNGEKPSEIWMYALFSCFFVNSMIFKMFKDTSTYDKDAEDVFGQIICNINCCAIVYGGFCGWGWDQLYNSGTCLEYNFGTFDKVTWGWELMTSAYISFYVQAVVCALIACFDLCMILVLVCTVVGDWCKKTPSPNVDTNTLEQVITHDPLPLKSWDVLILIIHMVVIKY